MLDVLCKDKRSAPRILHLLHHTDSLREPLKAHEKLRKLMTALKILREPPRPSAEAPTAPEIFRDLPKYSENSRAPPGAHKRPYELPRPLALREPPRCPGSSRAFPRAVNSQKLPRAPKAPESSHEPPKVPEGIRNATRTTESIRKTLRALESHRKPLRAPETPLEHSESSRNPLRAPENSQEHPRAPAPESFRQAPRAPESYRKNAKAPERHLPPASNHQTAITRQQSSVSGVGVAFARALVFEIADVVQPLRLS